MSFTRRLWLMSAAAVGMAGLTGSLTGCQTYPAGFGGLTLPSPHYLKHYPQYFPPDPQFPLQRELDSMQDPGLGGVGGLGGPGVGALPAPPSVLAPVPQATAPAQSLPGMAVPGGR